MKMNEETSDSAMVVSKKTTIMYSFAGIADTMSYQMFTFYIFNFYYTLVLGDIFLVTLGYIIWSIWNAINDPLLGALSDKTRSRWGRRKPYIISGIILTCIFLVLLWTVPGGSIFVQFIYFLIVICVFDLGYTAYSLNQTSLFPEMFQDLDQRAKANNYVQIFNIVGLLFAALLPGFLVTNLLAPSTDPVEIARIQGEYIFAAIIMAIIAAVFATLFILFGLKERKEYAKDAEKAPSFGKSVKFTFKNNAFRIYVITNLAQWYIFGLIPIMNPYFLGYIIGITGFMQSVFLAIVFISAIASMVLWRNYFRKHGAKRGHLTALIVLALTFIPFVFVWEIIGAIIAYILLGIGFGGVMFGRDVVMSAIIDKDEVETNIRREGAYYGVNALIIRFSTVLVSLSIAMVFSTVGWRIFDPGSVTISQIIGIRLLVFVFPVIALGLGILTMSKFPITKAKYEEIKIKIDELHAEKVRQTRE